MKIQMVDLQSQYLKIKEEVDQAVLNCIASAQFIKGQEVNLFENRLAEYLGAKHVISCANGTDALQIALMALELQRGDEVIVPAFTYVATVEAIALLGLKPVLVDVDIDTFNIDVNQVKKLITPQTKAIVPVHLFGQSADMNSIMQIAEKYNLYVIEDNAQSLSADYQYKGGWKKTGTIGHIGCTSFFPSKNLGCFGDGGALNTDNEELAEKIRMIANHGQKKKYYHELIGCNSRLDTIQAAVLNVKLPHLDSYSNARRKVASYYDEHLSDVNWLELPKQATNNHHVFNQYTLQVKGNFRDRFQEYLKENSIPTMIYYPLPLYQQQAFKGIIDFEGTLPVTEQLCKTVLSLPIHTEMTEEILEYIILMIKKFKP